MTTERTHGARIEVFSVPIVRGQPSVSFLTRFVRLEAKPSQKLSCSMADYSACVQLYTLFPMPDLVATEAHVRWVGLALTRVITKYMYHSNVSQFFAVDWSLCAYMYLT